MTAAAKKLVEEALALSEVEREELVEALSRSFDPVDVGPTWRAEIARRLAKIDAGEAVFHDAQAHAQDLRAKYE